jgi:hypothetical protein
MPPHSILVSTSLVALGLCTVPTALLGQTPADTLAPAASDSQPSGTDSVQRGSGASQAGADTVLQGAQRDSADTATAKAPRSAVKAGTPAATPEPADSILTAACTSATGSSRIARDLLVVVFAPEAGRAQRAAVAKSVKGKLLGAVISEPGAYYLRVPSGGGEYGLRVAADKLIQWDMVRQVGSRACPPVAPPDTARQRPS